MLENLEKLIDKAGILIEALPYIQKFYGKTIVVKYGGNAMVNEELKHSVMEDITLLKYIGMNPILVHGGGPDISAALKTYDIQSEFVNGLRVTDKQTVEIAQMVLTGKTNKEVVALLNQMGGNAVGLCGIDGNTIKCKKLFTEVDGKQVDIGYVGDIVEVNTHILNLLSSDAYIPVIAPIGVDEEGQSYNINADTVAAEVACALKAEKLIYLTDVSGVKNSDDKIVHIMNKETANNMIDDGTINGGMIPKVKSCIEAIDEGVNSVHILNGTIPHCILLEIFTDSGIGTMISNC